jgi:hypothetical protein
MVNLKTEYLEQFSRIDSTQEEYVSLVQLRSKFTAELRKYAPGEKSGIGFSVSEYDAIVIQFLGFTITATPRLVRAPSFHNELLMQWVFRDDGHDIEHWSFGLAADGWLYDRNSLTKRPDRICKYDDEGFGNTLITRVYVAFMASTILNP